MSDVTKLGIDETSIRKGHNYVTIFSDIQQHRVIDVQKGKDSNTINNFAKQLESKGGNRNKIEQICIDMSASFIAGTKDVFENAQITFDKFHIIQHLNNAMDTVRKQERINNDLLKGHKYTFLKTRC